MSSDPTQSSSSRLDHDRDRDRDRGDQQQQQRERGRSRSPLRSGDGDDTNHEPRHAQEQHRQEHGAHELDAYGHPDRTRAHQTGIPLQRAVPHASNNIAALPRGVPGEASAPSTLFPSEDTETAVPQRGSFAPQRAPLVPFGNVDVRPLPAQPSGAGGQVQGLVQGQGQVQTQPQAPAQERTWGAAAAAAAVVPAAVIDRPPDVFLSIRFGEGMTAARALKAALEAQGLSVFLCDANPGENVISIVAVALETSKLPVMLGTTTYGKKTSSPASSNTELHYIMSRAARAAQTGQRDAPFFLIKMCEEFSEPDTRFLLHSAIMYHRWMPEPNQPVVVPRDLVDAIVRRLRDLELPRV